MQVKEPFITLEAEGLSETVVQKSRFLGYAFPVQSEEIINEHILSIRKEHHSARHVCYGFRLGHPPQLVERSNDDGEPARTAGYPIWNLLDTRSITNALVVVVRYFGGIKLGTGGLIRAYEECASLAIDDAKVIEVVPEHIWDQVIPYGLLDTLEHHMIAVPNLRIVDRSYAEHVTLTLAVPWEALPDARRFLAEYLRCDPDRIAPETSFDS